MKSKIVEYNVEDLLQLRQNGMLSINPEYQRGAVWNHSQQKKLIDSVLREYSLPLIYLHHKKKSVAGMMREDLEIIDGQQRLNALELFKQGGLNLFDPIADDKIARFPKFVKDQKCPWAGLNFDSLSAEFQEKFLKTVITVSLVETEIEDEARDLFIRLQAGLPLNPQEKRDAWPGGYTEFVLKLGGKANNQKYPGHNFFKDIVSKNRTDRGEVRKLCAQVGMLFFENATHNNWCDVGTAELDDYYYRNLGFDLRSNSVNRFRSVLDKAYLLLCNKGVKKLKAHEAIHIILLIDSLTQDYSPSWEPSFVIAFEEFRKQTVIAKNNKDGEYWHKYVQWTMTSSDSKSSLMKRHNFFVEKMYDLINPKVLDPKRIFGDIERQLIYYRDNKSCAVCHTEISWDDLEIHHITEHQNGGQSILANGISVHKKCHPKGAAAWEFEKNYQSRLEK